MEACVCKHGAGPESADYGPHVKWHEENTLWRLVMPGVGGTVGVASVARSPILVPPPPFPSEPQTLRGGSHHFYHFSPFQ